MGKHERRGYLEAIRGRYLKADRAGKARMQDKCKHPQISATHY